MEGCSLVAMSGSFVVGVEMSFHVVGGYRLWGVPRCVRYLYSTMVAIIIATILLAILPVY